MKGCDLEVRQSPHERSLQTRLFLPDRAQVGAIQRGPGKAPSDTDHGDVLKWTVQRIMEIHKASGCTAKYGNVLARMDGNPLCTEALYREVVEKCEKCKLASRKPPAVFNSLC